MSKTNSGKIYRDDAVPGELIMVKVNSNKNKKKKKKPVILYMTDAIADFMLDGAEDMTEEDIEFERKVSNTLLAFTLSFPFIFGFIVKLFGGQ